MSGRHLNLLLFQVIIPEKNLFFFPDMKKKKPAKRLLIIGYVWPEPNSSAAGQRMMQLISLFRSDGWEITFASPAAKTEHMTDLRERGIDTAGIEVNSSGFDAFVEELDPSVVIFDRFVTEEQFGWRVAETVPDAVRILDTEDLHCLRKARRKAAEENRPFRNKDLLTTDTARREIAGILRCDLSLIISEAEMALLQDIFGVDPDLLYYLPFMLEPVNDEVREKWPAFETRDHFITIGNFRHAPNRDAVLFLKSGIWPLIRKKLPETEIHIYGAYPSAKIQKLHRPDEGFYIRGRISDAGAVVRSARVCLAPLRFGAGLKGKLVESMRCGTPSVTTDIGSEGIAGDLEWSGTVANDADEIASAAVRLYSNRSLWKESQEKGVRIINRRFSAELHGLPLLDRLSQLREILEQHRLNNFTGSMLMHHTAASTKYLSRWIEAKNSSG